MIYSIEICSPFTLPCSVAPGTSRGSNSFRQISQPIANHVLVPVFNSCQQWLCRKVRAFPVIRSSQQVSITNKTCNSFSADEPPLSTTRSNPEYSHAVSSAPSSSNLNLSASRVANYLEDPTTSHVQPRHISPQASTNIHFQTISYLLAVDTLLSGGK